MFFFSLFHVLLILADVLCFIRFYPCLKTTGRIWLGSGEINGPKQHVCGHLGQRYEFFFYILTNSFHYI